MVNLEHQLRTNGWLWALCTAAVFVLFGFFDPFPGNLKASPGSLWHQVAEIMRGEPWARSAGEVFGCAVFFIAPIGVAVGWILHAILVAGWDALGRKNSN
jgi:hypothetical protein